MRLALPESAEALADGLREVLERACPPSVVRAAWPGGEAGVVSKLWRILGESGIFGMLVGEDAGGLGLDEIHLVAVLEETGRAAVPGPVVETAAFIAPLLAALGDPTGDLGALLAGEMIASVQLAPDAPVPYGQLADLVVGNPESLVLRRTRDAEVRPVDTIDGARASAQVSGPSEPLAADRDVIARLVARATLATAAQLVGLATRMLEMTVAYVRAREQFGVPVGSFQAVKHHLANALIAIEFARPPVWSAAWSLATSSSHAHRDVSIAKVLASDCGRLVARTAIQCHGAMGYTVEYDLHLFAKRAWALSADWGSSDWHTAQVARSIGL